MSMWQRADVEFKCVQVFMCSSVHVFKCSGVQVCAKYKMHSQPQGGDTPTNKHTAQKKQPHRGDTIAH